MFFYNILSFLLLSGIPFIILLSLIGKKRYSLKTTTYFLWNKLLSTKKTSIKMQRLVKNISLILRILIIICIAFILAKPYIKSNKAKIKNNIVLVIDISASMKVPFQESTRIHKAKQKAYEIVSRLGEGNTMAIIEAGAAPRLNTPFTKDKENLKKGLVRLKATDEPASIEKSLEMAFSLIRGNPQDKVILISDGAFTLTHAHENMNLEYIAIGDNRGNIGITGFQIRKKNNESNTYEILINIQNNFSTKQNRSVEVTLGNETIIKENIDLEPFIDRSIIFTMAKIKGGILKAEIDSNDALLSDNRAWALLPVDKEIRVMLVSRGNFFLESVLRSYSGIIVTQADTLSYIDLVASTKSQDIIIFDCINPPHLINGNYILIKSFTDNIPLNPEGTLTTYQPVKAWDYRHPVMKSVAPSGFRVFETEKVTAGRNVHVLINGEDTPLLSLYTSGDIKAVCFSFDLYKSDLPLKALFPILIQNCISWLAGNVIKEPGQTIHTGDMYQIPLNPWIKNINIVMPDGINTSYRGIDHPFIFHDTGTAGIYQVFGENFYHQFAANITNKEESMINKRFSLLAQKEKEQIVNRPGLIQNHEIWNYFIIGCIILFLCEWFIWLKER